MATTRTLVDVEQKARSLSEAALTSGRPYLLSKLGKDLGEDLKIIKSHDLTLVDFIKKYLSGYDVVLGGRFKNVQSLVRSGDIETGIISDSTSDVQEIAETPKTKMRFNYKFWAAFSVPLSTGKRYINLDNFTFADDKEPENGRSEEIDPSYVAEDGIPNRDLATIQNIERWLTDKGYQAEQFAAKSSNAPANRTSAEARTVLHTVIDALDKRQLSSVSLPLDVVAALLHRHV